MNEPVLDCLSVVRQIWEFTDGELDPAADAAIREHLATCTGCAEHVAFCRALLSTLRTTPVDLETLAQVRARIQEALRLEPPLGA